MKRIKKIIESLLVISRTPSAVIASGWRHLSVDLSPVVRESESYVLINNLLQAIIGIAKDEEAKAAKDMGSDEHNVVAPQGPR